MLYTETSVLDLLCMLRKSYCLRRYPGILISLAFGFMAQIEDRHPTTEPVPLRVEPDTEQ